MTPITARPARVSSGCRQSAIHDPWTGAGVANAGLTRRWFIESVARPEEEIVDLRPEVGSLTHEGGHGVTEGHQTGSPDAPYGEGMALLV